jgi:hypothetical protein
MDVLAVKAGMLDRGLWFHQPQYCLARPPPQEETLRQADGVDWTTDAPPHERISLDRNV